MSFTSKSSFERFILVYVQYVLALPDFKKKVFVVNLHDFAN